MLAARRSAVVCDRRARVIFNVEVMFGPFLWTLTWPLDRRTEKSTADLPSLVNTTYRHEQPTNSCTMVL